MSSAYDLMGRINWRMIIGGLNENNHLLLIEFFPNYIFCKVLNRISFRLSVSKPNIIDFQWSTKTLRY